MGITEARPHGSGSPKLHSVDVIFSNRASLCRLCGWLSSVLCGRFGSLVTGRAAAKAGSLRRQSLGETKDVVTYGACSCRVFRGVAVDEFALGAGVILGERG